MWRKEAFVGRLMPILVGLGAAALVGCAAHSSGTYDRDDNSAQGSAAGHVAAASATSAGAYLVRIAGCNDCHTPGYSQSGGNVPLAQWLTGKPVGFRGPWGTSYASNLRLYVAPMSEDDWVRVMRARNDKPPMPWTSLHAMSDRDLRAVYQFIRSLGQAGKPTPADVPPGQEPKTPYVVDAPPTIPGAAGHKE